MHVKHQVRIFTIQDTTNMITYSQKLDKQKKNKKEQT